MTMPSYTRLLLEHWGVSVRDIPTSYKKESDFLAMFDNCKVLIEEKTKLDDPVQMSKRTEVLSKGEIHMSSAPIIRNNRLSGIISGAAKQLHSSSEQEEHDFRLIWFTGTGVEAEAKFEQFIATIYGSTKILEMNASFYRTCYFFRDSDFYRHSSILDGAVVAHVSGLNITAKLCINPLSPNAVTLRNSPVADIFGTAIEDPTMLENEGIAFILDGNVNRQNEEECLAILQAKYKTKPLMKFDLGYISTSVLVSDDDR